MSLYLQRSNAHADRIVCFILALSLIWIPATFSATNTLATDRKTARQFEATAAVLSRPVRGQGEVRAAYSALPLTFELNQGQTNDAVKFLARAGGYLLFLTPTEAVMSLDNPAAHRSATNDREESLRKDKNKSKQPGTIVRMKLEGANPAPRVEGLEELASRSNYFSGSDPAQWHTDIPSYARVRYSEVYPGIDMVYYGNQRQLEYDFVVAPGADPAVVQFAFKGIDSFEITTMGDLLLHTKQGDMVQSKPIAYQTSNGTRQEVSASYIRKDASGIGFQIGDYDRSQPLIIDPVLVYSTYLGGSGFDQGYGIAVDAIGSAYVTGKTAAIDFPTTSGALQTNFAGGDAAFITKINPEGTALVYSTYLNGASGNGIAVGFAGNAYITGEASTPNFPTTPGAFRTDPMGFDTFVTKLNSAGSALIYSARFGGNFDDFGRAIALDAAGNAYITGWTVCRAPTCTFPTVNAFQPLYAGGNNDAFVTKINSQGSALVYSTYLGGGDIINATEDWGQGIAVDSAGSAYVTGYTYSPDFPVTPGAYDTSRAGLDAFVTKFTPDGKLLVYSTFLGGAGREQAQGIAVDAIGNAYVTGLTESFDNPFTPEIDGFPVTLAAFQRTGSFDAFVTKLNPQGSALVYSTYLGGTAGVERGWAIAIDNAGSAYIAGDTTSPNFPIASSVQPAYGGGLSDAFVTKLNAAGSALVYSTFLGGFLYDEGRGIALDGNSDAFATGNTSSYNFPTANPLQGSNGGGLNNHDDAFVVKLGSAVTPPPTPTPTPTPTPAPVATLSSLTLNPTSVRGGVSTLGKVTLSSAASAGGAIVKLSSNNPAIASVAPSVTVASGMTSANFTITTKPVISTKSVTIFAAFGGLTRTAVLTVRPTDTVAVQRAEYTRGKKVVTVGASSTDATATLKVYVTATGALIGQLKNNGGGAYTGVLPWARNPQNITVKSSLGGAASRAVALK